MILLLFLLLISFSESFKMWEMAIRVDPKQESCFHHEWSRNRSVSFTYYVKHGGQGELDISFVLFDPNGALMINDLKQRGKNTIISTTLDGDYIFCFDNSHSSVNSKIVYFEFFDLNGDTGEAASYEFQPEDNVGLPDKFLEIVDKVDYSLAAVRISQRQSRMTETWDNYIIERKSSTINQFSAAQLVVMLFAGVVQVILIRSLFDERSRIHKIWRTK
ncbi:transmembrane emp24 domain-containing protein 5-like [Agrilus planipennis]|uniref:Transmembrane emp24 domain-containing protein 5-like n=1 Tax=Agrilus planipennis TaxID=224129 RepID=A0A1W4WEH8_AGRPL|nr:transmembrane emp24 domain-containing protein 5-like [Agrilus planipennis]